MRGEIAGATRGQLTLLATVEPDIVAGTTVAHMRSMASRARMDLGIEFLRVGRSLLRTGTRKSDTAELRSAIGRLYYGMYQAACAVVYDDFGGHDKNSHQELPKHLPKHFPNRAQSLNDLKDARIRRNEADYGPYPVSASHWQIVAQNIETAATAFVSDADNYLKAKGI